MAARAAQALRAGNIRGMSAHLKEIGSSLKKDMPPIGAYKVQPSWFPKQNQQTPPKILKVRKP